MRCAVWIVFCLFALVSGTAWAVPAASATIGTLEQQSLLFGVVGLGALGLSVLKLQQSALADSATKADIFHALRIVFAGVGLFGLPILAVELARGAVGEISRSALFAVAPVVILLAVAATETTGDPRRLLLPALAGLGGFLLLVPFDLSSSVHGELLLALVGAVVIVVGISSVALFRLLQGVRLAQAVALVCLPNAVFLLVCAGARSELAWSGISSMVSLLSLANLLINAAEIIAVVWLLREMPPERLSARFLLIPLITILESDLLIRPEWSIRIASGTLLLAGGVAVLLFWKEPGSRESGLFLH